MEKLIENKYTLSEEEKEQIRIWKEKYKDICKKYNIRVDNGVLENAHLELFTYPADFKTTFYYIDKYFSVIIKRSEENNLNGLSSNERINKLNELKKWWFGFLQGKIQEEESFKTL